MHRRVNKESTEFIIKRLRPPLMAVLDEGKVFFLLVTEANALLAMPTHRLESPPHIKVNIVIRAITVQPSFQHKKGRFFNTLRNPPQTTVQLNVPRCLVH